MQIAVNDDPDDENEDNCETKYWALQDANYNVLALVDSNGELKERYEYTPYGERTVYKSAGSEDALCMAPVTESQRAVEGCAHSICDVGMQGKFFEKEYGLYHWDQRDYQPILGRAMQPDPTGYPDGMNRFEWERSNPVTGLDPTGEEDLRIDVSGGRAYWIVENPGYVWDSNVGELSIGDAYGDYVTLDERYGGGAWPIRYLRARVTNSAYMGGLQPSVWSRGINLALEGRSPARVDVGSSFLAGAGEGAQGGGSIWANTWSFGFTDWAGWTDSDEYQGWQYTGSRIAMTVSRETFITALTLGGAQVARGGVEGTKALTYSGRVINWIAQSERAVRSARTISQGMVIADVLTGSYDVGGGLNQAIVEGDNWGYLRAGAGTLRAFSGFLGARELKTRPATREEIGQLWEEFQKNPDDFETIGKFWRDAKLHARTGQPSVRVRVEHLPTRRLVELHEIRDTFHFHFKPPFSGLK